MKQREEQGKTMETKESFLTLQKKMKSGVRALARWGIIWLMIFELYAIFWMFNAYFKYVEFSIFGYNFRLLPFNFSTQSIKLMGIVIMIMALVSLILSIFTWRYRRFILNNGNRVEVTFRNGLKTVGYFFHFPDKSNLSQIGVYENHDPSNYPDRELPSNFRSLAEIFSYCPKDLIIVAPVVYSNGTLSSPIDIFPLLFPSFNPAVSMRKIG